MNPTLKWTISNSWRTLQALATRQCTENATWYFNVDEDQTWTNYSLCGYDQDLYAESNTTMIVVIQFKSFTNVKLTTVTVI